MVSPVLIGALLLGASVFAQFIICLFIPNLQYLNDFMQNPTVPPIQRLGIELLLIYVPAILAGGFLGYAQRKPEYDFGDKGRRGGFSTVIGALSLVSVFGFAIIVFLMQFLVYPFVGALDLFLGELMPGLVSIILTVIVGIVAIIGTFLITISYDVSGDGF